MSGQLLAFIVLAVATGFTAVRVVTSQNLIHAAVYLAATLAGIGAVFLVLHADFLALVQILIYVGAIAVLFLFGLMLTRAPIGREALDSRNRGLGLAVSLPLLALLTVLIVDAFGDAPATELAGPTVSDLGRAIFSSWVFPFELASMLLLAALVGAVMLARRDAGESGEEALPTRVELSRAPLGGAPELEQPAEEPAGQPAGTGPGGGEQ